MRESYNKLFFSASSDPNSCHENKNNFTGKQTSVWEKKEKNRSLSQEMNLIGPQLAELNV